MLESGTVEPEHNALIMHDSPASGASRLTVGTCIVHEQKPARSRGRVILCMTEK